MRKLFGKSISPDAPLMFSSTARTGQGCIGRTMNNFSLLMLITVFIVLLLAIKILSAETDPIDIVVGYLKVIALFIFFALSVCLFGQIEDFAATGKILSEDENSLQKPNKDRPPVALSLDKASTQSQVESSRK